MHSTTHKYKVSVTFTIWARTPVEAIEKVRLESAKLSEADVTYTVTKIRNKWFRKLFKK